MTDNRFKPLVTGKYDHFQSFLLHSTSKNKQIPVIDLVLSENLWQNPSTEQLDEFEADLRAWQSKAANLSAHDVLDHYQIMFMNFLKIRGASV